MPSLEPVRPDGRAPLAERMRPRDLTEFVGQRHLVAEGKPLWRAISEDRLFSMILWGPPGSGKTTLARLIAHATRAAFVGLSAVLSGVKEVRAISDEAVRRWEAEKLRTVLFVDEIHRFNKAQQDAFLHHVEAGSIVLVGATTENPSFEVIPALLSRCRVFTLELLGLDDLTRIVQAALTDAERGLGGLSIEADAGAIAFLSQVADGDARMVLNALEQVVSALVPGGGEGAPPGGLKLTREFVAEVAGKKALLYDKAGEEHYNLISVFHKCLRGSDAQAAVYWLARMLEAGEDRLFIARRMVRFATEDVGNADPQALVVALSARDSFHFLGVPEGDLALFQAAVYLATAPKSNALYMAEKAVKDEISRSGYLPVPHHVRNAPTRLMKDLGYGKGYQYDHDMPGGVSPQTYLPPALDGRTFYEPSPYGFEKEIAKRIRWFESVRRRNRTPRGAEDKEDR